MDGKVEKGIYRAKGEVYQETGASSAGFRQKNEDGSRYIRLRNRRDFVYGV